jgi:hypothetical protein
MPMVPFEALPDESRLWVFAVERTLTEADQVGFLSSVDLFLETWAAHGVPLTSGRDFRRGQFLLVAVDEASAPPSGCSIDAMVGVLKDQERRLGLRILDNTPVWFVADGEVRRISRPEFSRLAEEGAVGPDTVVFDNTVTRLKDARAGRWEGPARESWHQRVFFKHSGAQAENPHP